jgi:xanthine dehydrogenase accessory factor
MDEPGEILRIASEWLAAGRGICMATIISKEGSGPREVGAKMVMSSAGETAGSIGGGEVERRIIEGMSRALRDGKAAVVDLDLSGEADDLDALCGGRISVFIEPVGEARRLFVIGAGHVGVALARLARQSGFAVALVDDREEYLARSGFKDKAETVCAGPGEVGLLGVEKSSFVVICTRGHSLDREWLQRLVDLEPRYLGMLGSRHKAGSIFESLAKAGVPRGRLEAVRTPVGLDIGALTPEEIAVSIVAELISEWRKTNREAGS